MNRIVLFTLFFLGFNALTIAQTEYQKLIQQERDSMDLEFGNEESTILTDEDFVNFHGLPYYDIDEKYRVKIKFKKIKNGKEFGMKTTTDRLPTYRPYGVVKFKIDGNKCKLTVYQNLELTKDETYKNYLFIPFTDLTSGMESYGGGRYIDIEIPELLQEEVYLDFNTCYNPYCAYNHRYSCPIPPSDNYINVSIRAGAKKWHD